MTLEALLGKLISNENSSAKEVLFRSQVIFSIHEDLFDESFDPQDEFFDASITDHMNETVGFLDCLFETVSVIRRVQDTHFLNSESQTAESVEVVESEVSSVSEDLKLKPKLRRRSIDRNKDYRKGLNSPSDYMTEGKKSPSNIIMKGLTTPPPWLSSPPPLGYHRPPLLANNTPLS